jgi:membrane protein YdbS with pleckstrin-like domain
MVVLVIAIGWGVTQGATTPLPAWVSSIAVASMLALFVTGVYMFFQFYWSKWRRRRRMSASGETRGALNSPPT